nr:FAD-dependent oxidoreductase [Aureliella helgolandensis]
MMCCPLKPLWLLLILCVCLSSPAGANEQEFDVVIYGGSSAGIAAAVQVRKMGGTTIVTEPSRRIGGLTTGGLGQTDIGNKAAIGGLAREFYQRIRKYYDQPKHWKWQQKHEYRSGGQTRNLAEEDAMWTFEPQAALATMQDWVKEYNVPVVYEQRLDRSGSKSSLQRGAGVQMKDGRIVAITMESGETYRGKMFLDATYEGDLLATAGVGYTVGREPNAAYQETLNGVQTQHAVYHQFVPGVDAYVVPGDPSSGLLPGVEDQPPAKDGSGDRRVQAYCFRMCLTDHPDNRVPFAKPSGYQPQLYELLLRNFEAGESGFPWINSAMPNRKTDTNNRTGFSTDFIGQNYSYPEASYAERAEIVAAHRNYQQGLMWTLANHPRVPEKIRMEVARWGTCRDEFEREDGWQEQLYIREARRMIGSMVMTQHHCQGREVATRPIALAAYTMDSHNIQRYVTETGHVLNEGDVEVGGFSPYAIDYGAVTPRREECENLLVPVCLSASHIAYGSIRMEPVFMVLGQSTATAAMHAIQSGQAVQNIDYRKLQMHLLDSKQILEWNGPKRQSPEGISVDDLPGTVLDDQAGVRQGFSSHSATIGPYVGAGYVHDGNANKGQQSIRFQFDVAQPGRYALNIAYAPHSNRATNVPLVLEQAGEKWKATVNQRKQPSDAPFGGVGEYELAKGQLTLEISNQGTDGYVVVDAVQLLPVESLSSSGESQ